MADNGVEMTANGGEGYSYQTGDVMFLTALAGGKTLTEAAIVAGISERTASRRMGDPAFCAELKRVQSETISQATVILGEAATEAVMTLRELLKSKSESVRLGAARAIVNLYLKAVDTGEIVTRGQIKNLGTGLIQAVGRGVRREFALAGLADKADSALEQIITDAKRMSLEDHYAPSPKDSSHRR